MVEVLQRALGASVAPTRVLLRHFDDASPDLLHHPGTADPLVWIGPLGSTQSRYPDLAIGTIIAVVVLTGAVRILRLR